VFLFSTLPSALGGADEKKNFTGHESVLGGPGKISENCAAFILVNLFVEFQMWQLHVSPIQVLFNGGR
jgi:hypothetical protein